MREQISRLAPWGALIVATAMFAACAISQIAGCASPQAAAAETAYAGQQTVCLKYPTHAERRACIDGVRAAWSPDGGVQ